MEKSGVEWGAGRGSRRGERLFRVQFLLTAIITFCQFSRTATAW